MVGYLRLFFFFQAEDGIRDKLVNGVQTCALPISLREIGAGKGEEHPLGHRRALPPRECSRGRGTIARAGRSPDAPVAAWDWPAVSPFDEIGSIIPMWPEASRRAGWSLRRGGWASTSAASPRSKSLRNWRGYRSGSPRGISARWGTLQTRAGESPRACCPGRLA